MAGSFGTGWCWMVATRPSYGFGSGDKWQLIMWDPTEIVGIWHVAVKNLLQKACILLAEEILSELHDHT